ncbi:MAG: peptide ABC transporter ATP-binding protein [Acidobacteria bacterium RIFCSPLOWO2_02_FULL_60_20]|nr:MAG: peptide ABC transporter ATP-binding protein [Acidobacteria bacterium RIFCSPLOWO2_02_FULL_60_20]
MTPTAPILALLDLRTHFFAPSGIVKAVDGVSLELGERETLGIVGESGSGKTATCLSILGLIPPPGRIVGGKVMFEGRNLVELTARELRQIRGKRIGMVFQDPMTSLNPFLTIGDQLMETLLVHDRLSKPEARRRAVEMLEKVGISDAAARLGDYPHRFSGGMRQRVMIAMALLGNPKVLIADEPTTALDATIQAQVLDLFRHIKSEFGAAILLITHNLGIVAGMADRVAVMYAGRVVESGPTDELFYRPRHPYTLALLQAVPRLGNGQQEVAPIAGSPPDLANLPAGCAFYDRCPFRLDKCKQEMPPLEPVAPNHNARCWVDISGKSEPRP